MPEDFDIVENTAASGQQSVAIGGDASAANVITGNGNRIANGEYYIEALNIVLQDPQVLHRLSNSTSAERRNSMPENEPLAIAINSETLDIINSRLSAIERLQRAGQIPDAQKDKFDRLRGTVHALKEEMTKELELLAQDANQILKESIALLTKKLQDLDHSLEGSLRQARSQFCLKEQIELLKQFQNELEDGKVVAAWLDGQRSEKQLAQVLAEYALEIHPQIKETMSPRQLEAFQFSIEQFLEQLSHCLTWGRNNILNDPDYPIYSSDEVYATAFGRLKCLIPEHLPIDGIEQLREHIDYLLQMLPRYERVNVD